MRILLSDKDFDVEQNFDLIGTVVQAVNMDDKVCDGEATEIVVRGILEQTLNPQQTLNYLLRKLNQLNGKITIIGVDPLCLCESFIDSSINIETLNAFITDVKAFISLSQVIEILSNMKIIRASYEGNYYCVEAEYGE